MILDSVFYISNVETVTEYAMNGSDAYQCVVTNVEENNFEKCDFHLILIDNNMPVMDGCDASIKIREYLKELNLP